MATQVYRTLAKIVGAVLLVVGIAALFGGNFAHGFVREQLEAQNITMPTTEAIDAQVASGRITEGNAVELRKYAADGPMSTGPQARAFADEYILSHMRAGAKAAGVPEEQATYSGIGEVVSAKTAQLRAELKAVPENASKTDQEIAALAAQEIANPATDFSLAKEIKSLQDLRTSTFLDGNTLRGMLLNAYGWWLVGTIALVAGWTLIVVGVGLLALGLVLKPRASTGDGPVAARQ